MSRPIHVLELRSVRGTGGGPEKTIILGAARTDPDRFRVTVCYLRDRRDESFAVTDRFDVGTIDYVEVHERHSLDAAVWPRLRRIVLDREIDIIHAHEYKTDILAWALAHVTDAVPLATVHGWTGNSARERFVYYPADKLVLRRFPRLIAVSSDIRNELIRYGAYPSRITTILNGINPETFRRDSARVLAAKQAFGFGPEDIVIGAIGRLERQKRFDLLIAAFDRLRRDCPRLKLIIAGDGSLRHALEQQRAEFQLNDSISLPGHVSDVVWLHHALDVFVQSSDYEGTPNAVLEAMALETPIVATDVGGTSELVRNGIDGFVVRSGGIQPIVGAVAELLADPERARSMVRRARDRVETDLSFDVRMKRVERIYEDLAQNRVVSTRPATSAPA